MSCMCISEGYSETGQWLHLVLLCVVYNYFIDKHVLDLLHVHSLFVFLRFCISLSHYETVYSVIYAITRIYYSMNQMVLVSVPTVGLIHAPMY